jgi:hypothetical protein
MSIQAAAERLRESGWREYPNQFKRHARCFYKWFPSVFRCQHNEDKPGIQVELAVSVWDERTAYELEIVGGLPDGTSISLHNYGLPKDIGEVVALVQRLVRLWDLVHSTEQPNG